MADVRSLLRNERNSRRINHPQATYSTTGTLVCLVCHIQLKAESLWNKHLRSSQHAMRLQRIRDGTLGRPPGAPAPVETESAPMNGNVVTEQSKKRKADDEEQPVYSKKAKATDGVPGGFFDDGKQEGSESEEPPVPASTTSHPTKLSKQPPLLPSEALPPSNTLPTPPNTTPTIDESEWAAFERDVASPPPQISALTSSATISAAPLTAAEIAAQSRQDASLQAKEKREAELEGEKEDAARQMEEEFDDMAGLEERVRLLKEKREALRRDKVAEGEGSMVVEAEEDFDDDNHETSDDDDDDNDEDDWGQWG